MKNEMEESTTEGRGRGDPSFFKFGSEHHRRIKDSLKQFLFLSRRVACALGSLGERPESAAALGGDALSAASGAGELPLGKLDGVPACLGPRKRLWRSALGRSSPSFLKQTEENARDA